MSRVRFLFDRTARRPGTIELLESDPVHGMTWRAVVAFGDPKISRSGLWVLCL
jgi:hypothetical protein